MLKPSLDDVTVEITNQCQLHCRRCHIWMEKDRHEIARAVFINTIEKLLASFVVRSISLTGGEPFLHSDITEMLRYLAALRGQGRIRSFGIYTNGATHEKIALFLEKEQQLVRGMSIGISVDGLARTHDALRGAGAYQRTMKTLKLLQDKYTGFFNVELKFTVGTENYQDLFAVYNQAVRHGFKFTPKLVERDVAAYYHRCAKIEKTGSGFDAISFLPGLRQQMALVLQEEASGVRKAIDPGMIRMMLRIAREGSKVIRGCQTPDRCLFITSRGDMYPCLYMAPAGSLYASELFSDDFMNKRNARVKDGSSACCPRCMAYHGFLKNFNTL